MSQIGREQPIIQHILGRYKIQHERMVKVQVVGWFLFSDIVS